MEEELLTAGYIKYRKEWQCAMSSVARVMRMESYLGGGTVTLEPAHRVARKLPPGGLPGPPTKLHPGREKG